MINNSTTNLAKIKRANNKKFRARIAGLPNHSDVERAVIELIARQDANAARRKEREFGSFLRQCRDNERIAARLPEFVAELEAEGWASEHTSESGSRYFTRGGERLRLADHYVPASAIRDMAAADRNGESPWDYEIIIGKRGWDIVP